MNELLERILNKSAIKVTFSNNPELNLHFEDLMEECLDVKIEDSKFLSESAGANSTELGAIFYVRTEVEIKINRLSAKCPIWLARMTQNAHIPGSASVALDDGITVLNFRKCIIGTSGGKVSGTEPEIPVILRGDMQINQLLKI